jgi:hypothetical protein
MKRLVLGRSGKRGIDALPNLQGRAIQLADDFEVCSYRL